MQQLCKTYQHQVKINWITSDVYTVYPKKYAHGYCFAVLCCGYTLTDFPISIRLTSLALWQSNDCPSASKATLMNMDKYFMWIHYERLHNHNKEKYNKTVCIFLGIYCATKLTSVIAVSVGDLTVPDCLQAQCWLSNQPSVLRCYSNFIRNMTRLINWHFQNNWSVLDSFHGISSTEESHRYRLAPEDEAKSPSTGKCGECNRTRPLYW